MAKKRVFVSFDYDNDKSLRDLILGQAKSPDSPFDVTNVSLKEAAPDKEWEGKARKAIAGSDIVLIMLGAKTAKASGVLKEVAMATELGKPRFQVIGPKGGSKDWAVPGGGRVYSWNWENLKNLLN